MTGHSVTIVHGYGDNPSIAFDKFTLKNVKEYVVRGEKGKLPEVTIVVTATSVAYEAEGGKKT